MAPGGYRPIETTMPINTVELAKELIARPSVTPDDAGCLDLITDHLAPLGFHCERFSANGVDNLWARRGNHAPPTPSRVLDHLPTIRFKFAGLCLVHKGTNWFSGIREGGVGFIHQNLCGKRQHLAIDTPFAQGIGQ